MDDEWTGDAKDTRRIIGAKLLIFGKDRNALPLEEMAERGLQQRRRLWREQDGLVPARLAPDSDLDPVSLDYLGQWLSRLSVPIG
jgi:hypothetical protein